MLQGLFFLLLLQLVGESVARGFALPVPGPVIGIMLLVAALMLRDRLFGGEEDRVSSVETAADGMLRHLGLLFVPAGVGIAQSWRALDGVLLPVAAALVGSTIVTMIVTVAVFRLVARRLEKGAPE